MSINPIDLTNLMKGLISKTMRDYASSKTRKYFIGNDSDFELRVEQASRTIVAIVASPSSNSMISVKDEMYAVRDYQVPEHVLEIAKSTPVYMSKSAFERRAPIHMVDKPSGEMMSPMKLKAFFEGYNANQGVGYPTIKLVDASFGFEYSQMCDLSCVYVDNDGDPYGVQFNEGGAVHPEVVQLLQIGVPIPEDVLKEEGIIVGFWGEEALGKWLLSIE